MKEKYNIWVFVKDSGGTHNMMSVCKELQQRGYKVLVFGTGKSVDIVPKQYDMFTFVPVAHESGAALVKTHGRPDVVFTSVCSGGGPGRNVVPYCREQGIPTIAVQDMWGTRVSNDWSDMMYRPSIITTHDNVGKKLIKKAWPEYDESAIITTGFPHVDKFYNAKVKSRDEVRQQLGFRSDHDIFVLFAGQGPGTSKTLAMLRDIVCGINASPGFQETLVTMLRPHPRVKDDFPEEVLLWQEETMEWRSQPVVHDWFNLYSMWDLVNASDLVVSMFSSTLIEAVALRRPALSLLPPWGMDAMQAEIPLLTQHPLVENGCVLGASTKVEAIVQLRHVLREPSFLTQTQIEKFPLDGKNAERVADVVLRYF